MSDSSYDAVVSALMARQPQRMVPDLDRITLLSELLGRPDQGYPSIQLTGTNGKSSTAAMITSLLGGLGLTAGTYTSPHLQDVRERIRLAGEPLSRDAFASRYAEVAAYLTEVDARSAEPVTFFEALTALAFAEFADAPVDVGVFEVGLGGVWDATNLVRGEVAVLGRIGLDHAVLGGTVEEVAREKVGIIKRDATVISAPQTDAVVEILEETSRERDARLLLSGRDFGVVERHRAVGGQQLTLRGATGTVDEVFLPLYGAHQAENATCALAAVEGFLGFAGGLDDDLLREAFAAVRVPGRLELVGRGEQAPVLLDGAHNPPGAAALATALAEDFSHHRRVIVLGVLADKDVEGIVNALAPVADVLVATEPPSPRAASSTERVAKAAEGQVAEVEVVGDVADAVGRASELAGAHDIVIVSGSLYSVGAARSALGLAPA